ncbi:8-oxo-dGTP diphosphatase [Candidatus Parcubacteria bacterium]|nr:MAG: 8-oxo-dGTP diphosphatase [Candidatus Parcubacteria bacterium]
MITLTEYRSTLKIPLKKTTLCFLVKKDKVLLGMKKIGFGKGRWNGFGGKVKIGENEFESALRELEEESGVRGVKYKHYALLHFYFPLVDPKEMWNQQVFVYLIDKWQGSPKESNEMIPKWFDLNSLPFDKMWPDDVHWVPKVLSNEFVEAHFMFGKNDSLLDFELETK